ncbi:monosaccharide ABC transporter substrate-binding protein (CUT2 family) [Georgenia soli]|uniref:Monosaccharide ABC transporter substrate-binding protein (CUT2 family) n=1 Tax=Georgenia soli TaxID=638953 RepID=A0A2A9F281_9MICO|nr:substrate-binding domain-containing protein [Georgenia soli]PFG44881.1 monosaccharide ABC transporter substrate-binding protein (CUT2 family) [Georgenia soli]
MSRGRLRKTMAAPLVGGLALMLTACSNGAGAAPGDGGDEIVIGASVADQKSLFYVAAAQGMEAAAEELGVELRLTSANNDSAQQVKQINDLITQQIDALVFISQDSTAAASGVAAANAADVPVYAVDQRPEDGSGDLATYIATDSVKAARDLCTWMFDQMGGSGKIAIIRGVLGSTAEIQRTQGCNEALEEYPDIEVVAEDAANWDETEAYGAAQNMLAANPDLDAFFAESDAMAMGAAKAAQQAGRHEGMYFVGIDGFPTMFDAVSEGLVQATMAQQPYAMGKLAVEQAVAQLKGEGDELEPEQYQDTVLITSENVDTEDVKDYYGPDAKRSN